MKSTATVGLAGAIPRSDDSQFSYEVAAVLAGACGKKLSVRASIPLQS